MRPTQVYSGYLQLTWPILKLKLQLHLKKSNLTQILIASFGHGIYFKELSMQKMFTHAFQLHSSVYNGSYENVDYVEFCNQYLEKGKTFENFEQKYTKKGKLHALPLSHA